MTITIVINDAIAREGLALGHLKQTPDGYRFTDPEKSDFKVEVVHEDAAAPVDLSRLVEWRPPDGR